MTLLPLLNAPLIVQLHVAAAVPALFIGPFALFGRTSWRWHKITGYIWCVAMVAMALTALFIPSFDLAIIGHLGPIHIFSFVTLWGVTRGIWLARDGQIAAHRISMKWTWFGAMGATSLLNFLPGRTINRMVFDGPSDAGLLVIAAGCIVMVILWQLDRGRMLRSLSAI